MADTYPLCPIMFQCQQHTGHVEEMEARLLDNICIQQWKYSSTLYFQIIPVPPACLTLVSLSCVYSSDASPRWLLLFLRVTINFWDWPVWVEEQWYWSTVAAQWSMKYMYQIYMDVVAVAEEQDPSTYPSTASRTHCRVSLYTSLAWGCSTTSGAASKVSTWNRALSPVSWLLNRFRLVMISWTTHTNVQYNTFSCSYISQQTLTTTLVKANLKHQHTETLSLIHTGRHPHMHACTHTHTHYIQTASFIKTCTQKRNHSAPCLP